MSGRGEGWFSVCPEGVGDMKPRTERSMGVGWAEELLSRNKIAKGTTLWKERSKTHLLGGKERESHGEAWLHTCTSPHSSHTDVFVCVCVCVCVCV